MVFDEMFEHGVVGATTRSVDEDGCVLAASEVVKVFGDDAALRGVSVGFAAGEVVAVTGPSGCGKSTLLHCLAGVVVPDSGRVVYRGQDMTTMEPAHRSRLRREDFGFVFQFGQLVPELRAVDDVALPLLLAGVRRKDAIARAREMLDRVGVGGMAARRPGQMSGGQSQRVAIARALIGEPRVVFADEPTGSLDSVTGAAVMDLFLEVVRERGATLVVVTHDGSVAERASRVVTMRDGQVRTGGA